MKDPGDGPVTCGLSFTQIERTLCLPYLIVIMRQISPLLAAILLPLAPNALQAALVISEVQAANATTLVDADGDSSDWLELYNSGPGSVDLSGYHLTDDPADLSKWTIPPMTLQPGGFLVVFASGKDRDPVRGELHTSFRLSAGGDYLGLVMADGVTVVDEDRKSVV